MTMTIEKIEFPRRETKQSKSKKSLTIDSEDEPVEPVEEIDPVIAPLEPTTTENNEVVTAGGRVIAVSSYGNDIKSALLTSYENAKVIQFDKKYYRKDLGFDL